ncbi:MAG: futalosine hydrolase [Bacteroidota bacterium]
MKILIVAATQGEIQSLKQSFSNHVVTPQLSRSILASQTIDWLTTGIGMVNTGLLMGHYLAVYHPDVILHVGIGGSFDRSVPLGSVVYLTEDVYADMGADSPDGFLHLQEMGFPSLTKGTRSWYHRYTYKVPSFFPTIPRVSAITLNTVTGQDAEAHRLQSLWHATVETMEGAAALQAATWAGIPCIGIRGISNYVETRNKAGWKIALAIHHMQTHVAEVLSLPSNEILERKQRE